jgi:hypothetical protein
LDRTSDHGDVRVMTVIEVVTTMVVSAFVGSDLDLDAIHAVGHGDHDGAHIVADVEQDRALAGVRVLGVAGRGAHDAFVEPGFV